MLEYHPRHHYVNDFTVIEKGGRYHLFHITGMRYKMSGGLTDLPKQGHAVSHDLVHWEEQPFVTSLGGACSAVKLGRRYALLENVNRVCWSRDLCSWSDPEPLACDFADHANVYETHSILEEARYPSHRDPNIHWDAEHNCFVMFFCSRVSYGKDLFTRGCVGLAESADLVHWRLQPPVLGPGRHLFCESPHVIDFNGKFHLFFTISPENGLRHAVAERLRGPYTEVEDGDVLPAYVCASETVNTKKDGWIFLGRLEDRNERCNQARLAPRALCLPLGVGAHADNRVFFTAQPCLAGFRGACLFDSRKHSLVEHWQPECGDWRVNTSAGLAANRHEPIPPNSLYGSSANPEARISFARPVADFDLEFRFQLPTFNGNDVQYRGGFMVDGVRFTFDALAKAIFCRDATGDILAVKPVSLWKCDRYYQVRVFRSDGITQLFLDGELQMYLPAYGDGSRRITFCVDHSDVIITDIRLWELNVPAPAGFSLDDPRGETMNGIYF